MKLKVVVGIVIAARSTVESGFYYCVSYTMNYYGSIVAIVTPMDEGGRIDYAALDNLLQWHISEGSDGIVIAGTTGESPTLSTTEHQELIAKTVELVGGRVPVIAGVGSNSTEEGIALARQAYADGADCGLSVVPYYNKPTQEGLYRHFAAIADKAAMPMILYDVPRRCVVGLQDETVARLAQLDNIIGIKDATGEPARVGRLRALAGDDFCLLTGDDESCCDYILAGGDGVISVTANVAPKNMWRMVDAARKKDTDAAKRLDARLQPYHRAQAIESSPIPTKAALCAMGKIQNGIRLPLTPLSPQHWPAVEDALASAQGDNE